MVALVSTNAFVPPLELALDLTIAPARAPPAPPDAGATAVLLCVARTVMVVPGLWMFAPDEIEAESVALIAESPSVKPPPTRLITNTPMVVEAKSVPWALTSMDPAWFTVAPKVAVTGPLSLAVAWKSARENNRLAAEPSVSALAELLPCALTEIAPVPTSMVPPPTFPAEPAWTAMTPTAELTWPHGNVKSGAFCANVIPFVLSSRWPR